MVDFEFRDHYDCNDLLRIVRILRHPGGCPWDAAQTHESLRRCFLEEACEAVEAIDLRNDALLREELGDVLLQVVFHASLAEDEGKFTLDDVADGVCKKMIFRHPHVFGAAEPGSAEEALQNWDALKRAEKGQETCTDALEAVARTLPGLWRAEKLLKKAAGAGFTWREIGSALDKLSEETEELRRAVAEDSNVFEELGDVLFAAAGVARFAGVDPEAALHAACEKYISRFSRVERGAAAQQRKLDELPLEEMVRLWNEAKTEEQHNTQSNEQEDNEHE